jgi:hypothetical protein
MELRTDMAAGRAISRRKARLMTAANLDRRTRGGKRARKLAVELARGFGAGITEVQRRACEQAGMLAALAEDLAARRLAGQPVPFDELLRAEGCAKRAIRTVLAECPAPPAPPRFSPMKVVREAARKVTQVEKEPSSDDNPVK